MRQSTVEIRGHNRKRNCKKQRKWSGVKTKLNNKPKLASAESR